MPLLSNYGTSLLFINPIKISSIASSLHLKNGLLKRAMKRVMNQICDNELIQSHWAGTLELF